MPKILFKNQVTNNIETENSLSLSKPIEKTETKIEPLLLKKILRKKRSSKYMEAIQKLDAGGHVHNQEVLDEIIKEIREELPEIEIAPAGLLLGYLSKCYLGVPYEVHILDFSMNIVEHYKKGEALPTLFEKGRSLAASGNYEFIEIYIDRCCAVSSDGSVAMF